MSEISSNSTVSLVLADFASIDDAGKANIIGGGISFIGFDSASNTSVPFALYVQVSAAVQSLQENEASIEILLQDMDGNQVMLPGHTGTPEPMRIAQAVEFKVNQPPGTEKPRPDFPALVSFALNFSNGLPLQLGTYYQWVVRVDGDDKGYAFFAVPRPQAPPVFG